ncbi:MAG TPA: GAF domain-containing protein [Chloroflexota bacterium]|jgi:GAF domain-containing protein
MPQQEAPTGVLPSVTTEQLLLLAETSAAIGATEDLEQALRALLGGMARLTGADSGGLRLLAEADPLVAPHRLFFWVSGDTYIWREMKLPLGPNTRRAVLFGEAVYTPDLLPLMEAGDAVAAIAVQDDGLRSSLIVPLRAGGRVIGTLHADSRRPNAFHAALLIPLQLLADHTAGAVERTRLAEAERLGRAAQLRAEAAIRTARAVTHELGSPIGAALGLVELLTAAPRLPGDVQRDLQAALHELIRAADLLKGLGRIERYEEMASPIGPQLDIRRATGSGAADRRST